MNLSWDLRDLFKSNEDFYKEMKIIDKLLSEIKKYEKERLDADNLLDILNLKWKIKELANNVLIYGSLMYYKNVNSDECIKMKKDAERFYEKVNLELSFIDRKILELGKDKVSDFINKNEGLNVYKLAIENLFRMLKHVQDDKTNKKISENLSSINSNLDSYNNLLRDVRYGEIKVNDKILEVTPSNFVTLLASNNREIRKMVYFLVNKEFKNNADEFATILNSILNYRNKNSKLEKYNSVLEKVLFEENIDSEIVLTLIKSVNDNLKLIQDYLKIKAKMLGISEMHLYDLSAPISSDFTPKYTLEEGISIIKNALKPLGENYLKVVNYLLDGHIDATLDENKHQSITFSWHTYSFMNFRGTYVDLKNLIHELGHIVNYYLSKKDQPYIYEDSTIFVGETASIVNEILLNRYLYESAKTDEEKAFYLSKEISNYFTSVYKQTMYTEFENILYNLIQTKEISSKDLSEEYTKLIKKYYGDDIVYDEDCIYEWTRLGHLYRWSYYPYKYATGLLIASLVVNKLLDEKSLSMEQYIKFLSKGSSMYSKDLLKLLNIDLKDLNIFKDGFKVLEEDIEKLRKVSL